MQTATHTRAEVGSLPVGTRFRQANGLEFVVAREESFAIVTVRDPGTGLVYDIAAFVMVEVLSPLDTFDALVESIKDGESLDRLALADWLEEQDSPQAWDDAALVRAMDNDDGLWSLPLTETGGATCARLHVYDAPANHVIGGVQAVLNQKDRHGREVSRTYHMLPILPRLLNRLSADATARTTDAILACLAACCGCKKATFERRMKTITLTY